MGGCSAVNCSNSTRKKIRLFRFPADPVRRKQWQQNCRRGGDWKPTSSSRLCEMHFEENQFESHREDGWKKLKVTAIPTIFDLPNLPPMFQQPEKKSLFQQTYLDKMANKIVPEAK